MKILEIIPTLASGGAEKFTVNLSNQFAKMGHTVALCTLYDTKPKEQFNRQFLDPNIEYHCLNISGMPRLKILYKTYKFIKATNPDVIHCHLSILQYILLICLFKRNIPIFHTLHSITKHANGGKKNAILFKFLYKYKFVKPVTISNICHRSFVEFYHLDNDTVIENGGIKPSMTCKFQDVLHQINSLKTSKSTKIFVHVGRFHKAKNQKLLIDAFNKLATMHIDFRLLIIGAGFDDIDAKCIRNQSCDNIHFIGEKNNVTDYLFCADYFCLTSVYEGLPISLLEAMACGVTPICTPAGGILDIITNGENGYLSKDFSADSYVNTILKALSHPLNKEHIMKYYDANYTIEKCSQKYITLFTRQIK